MNDSEQERKTKIKVVYYLLLDDEKFEWANHLAEEYKQEFKESIKIWTTQNQIFVQTVKNC